MKKAREKKDPWRWGDDPWEVVYIYIYIYGVQCKHMIWYVNLYDICKFVRYLRWCVAHDYILMYVNYII